MSRKKCNGLFWARRREGSLRLLALSFHRALAIPTHAICRPVCRNCVTERTLGLFSRIRICSKDAIEPIQLFAFWFGSNLSLAFHVFFMHSKGHSTLRMGQWDKAANGFSQMYIRRSNKGSHELLFGDQIVRLIVAAFIQLLEATRDSPKPYPGTAFVSIHKRWRQDETGSVACLHLSKP